MGSLVCFSFHLNAVASTSSASHLLYLPYMCTYAGFHDTYDRHHHFSIIFLDNYHTTSSREMTVQYSTFALTLTDFGPKVSCCTDCTVLATGLNLHLIHPSSSISFVLQPNQLNYSLHGVNWPRPHHIYNPSTVHIGSVSTV